MKKIEITEEDIIELRDKIDKLNTTHEYLVGVDTFGDLNLNLLINSQDNLINLTSGEKITICYFCKEDDFKLESCGWIENFLSELVREDVLSTFVKGGDKIIENKKAEQIRKGNAKPTIKEMAAWLMDPENEKQIEQLLDEMFPNLRKDEE